jgi:hypothetical protein
LSDESKWAKLNSELHIHKVYMQENDLKEFLHISIH